MSTTFVYLNLVLALLSTMFVAGSNVYLALVCVTWLAASAWYANRVGLLNDEN